MEIRLECVPQLFWPLAEPGVLIAVRMKTGVQIEELVFMYCPSPPIASPKRLVWD